MSDTMDLGALRALISPISHLRMEGGNVTIGAEGLDGLLEWFSSEGDDRPDVMMAVAAACNAAPALLSMVRSQAERIRELEAGLREALGLVTHEERCGMYLDGRCNCRMSTAARLRPLVSP